MKDERVVLRPATVADHALLCRLDAEIFSYGAAEEPAVILGRLTVFPAGCRILEWHQDGRAAVAGYLTTEKWAAVREPALDENPYETHIPDGRVLNITTLAIVPAFQKRQLGPVLLREAETIARQHRCQQIVLETAHAKQWYERHGYELLGERDQRGFPLYIMSKAF